MLKYLDLGFMKIPMYTFMMFIGLVALAVYVIIVFRKVEKYEWSSVLKLMFLSAISFIVMGISALFFNSLFHSIEKGKLVIGGITWLGGVIGSFPLMVFLIHKFFPGGKGNALRIFALLVPGIALAHGFGRIGCFCGGCCYGAVTDSIFGVRFPEGSSAAKLYPAEGGGSLPVLPTQLFEAFFEFALFTVMMIFFKKFKPHFLNIYLFGYGTFRFIMEFFRGDDRGATGIGLTPSQFMSLVLITTGILLVLYARGIIFKDLAARMRKYRENPQLYAHAKRDSKEDVVSLLRELKSLKEEGIITEYEFEEKKKELLQIL